jgi:hypothetical protein
LGKILNIDIVEENDLKLEEKEYLSNMIISIHNLLTREENDFHFKKSIEMFSVKKEIAEIAEKSSFSCILTRTSSNLKEKHELFSIFSKPVYSPFSRTDKLTCFFTILFMALLMEIMYYDTEVESEEEATSLTGGLDQSSFQFVITTQTVSSLIFKFFLIF